MTIDEYLDPERFPLTTQRGLDAVGQLLIDSVNYDQLRKLLDEGGTLDEEHRQRWTELQEKMRHHAAITSELARAEIREKVRKLKS